MKNPYKKPSIIVHASNITGVGATQLCKSLFNSLERNHNKIDIKYYISSASHLANYIHVNRILKIRSRALFNSLKRVLECLLPNSALRKCDLILVMGDIPLRLSTPQIVYVHQPHLISPDIDLHSSASLKYRLMRFLFRINIRYASCFVVQTNSMRDRLMRTYPIIKNVIVIGVPPADIFGERRTISDRKNEHRGLRLFYPASDYPHKNHALIHHIGDDKLRSLNVDKIIFTIKAPHFHQSSKNIIDYRGPISLNECLKIYQQADALLFLSNNESYGIPLVEAMHMGISVICPDLPYARDLCGEGAIYFEPNSPESLYKAIAALQLRISRGKTPNWDEQLSKIPASWKDVSDIILRKACDIVGNKNNIAKYINS